jgi:hypothetical protein
MQIATNFYGINLRARQFIWQLPSSGDSEMNKTAQKPNRVTAVFQDSRLSFDLARGATFAQLAERLGRLGEAHGGLPLSVDVRVPVESAR